MLAGPILETYQRIGFHALPVTINQTYVDYAIRGTKSVEHTIGEQMLKQLPRWQQCGDEAVDGCVACGGQGPGGCVLSGCKMSRWSIQGGRGHNAQIASYEQRLRP